MENDQMKDSLEWLIDNGFQSTAEGIEEFAADPDIHPHRYITLCKIDLIKCQEVHDDDPDPAVYAAAYDHLDIIEIALTLTYGAKK
jgi:hypothetical protein